MNNLRYFKEAFICNIKSVYAYKISFIIQSSFMIVNNLAFLIIWSVIFSQAGDNINGVTFNSILYLWSLPVMSFGIAYFFFGGLFNINEYLISGQMDSYMLQPKNVLINILTSKCEFSAFGDLIYGIVLGFIATKGNLMNFTILVLLGIFGSIFYVSTEIFFRSLSVWLGNTEEIATRYSRNIITTFSTYPEKMFIGVLKVILFTVVPVGYLAYFPIQIILDFDIFKLIVVILVGLLYLFISVVVFNKALKCYESGNNISMRN